MQRFNDIREELLFLFGEHLVELATTKGAAYHLRRVDQRTLRDANNGLRARIGPERVRYARSLEPEVAGAIILALLDPEGWNKLVLEAAVAKVPEPRRRRRKRKPTKTSSVRRRRIRSSRLDRSKKD